MNMKSKELEKRAKNLFNNIKPELYYKMFIFDSKNYGIDFLPCDITKNNTYQISEIISFSNDNWKEFYLNQEIFDNKEQLSKLECYESPVFFDNEEDHRCYRIFLFLNLDKYETVKNTEYLDLIASRFLEFYCKELQFENNFLEEETAKSEIFTEAAEQYMSEVVYSLFGIRNYLFYRNILTLTTQKYESNITKGKILLGKEIGSKNLEFEEKINITENLRMARKAIQLTTDDTFLICDSESFIGLHYKTGKIKYDMDYFIEFLGYNSFKLLRNGETIFEVKDGVPGFPKDESEKYADFEKALFKVKPSISNTQVKLLKKHIKSIAEHQKHGTVIVILDNAAEEATRLENISIKIKNAKSVNINSRNKYKTFGEIDGAILMDFDGHCHSFGVILDGVHLKNEGNRERGSRYNSSLRYLRQNQKKEKTLIIVMSEDGGFDILK